MKIEIEIDANMIADQMITAIEGGSNYWCRSITLSSGPSRASLATPWYSDPNLYRGDFRLLVIEDEPSTNGHDGHHIIGPDAFVKGIAKMASSKQAWHFGNMVSEYGDAETADVFLQFIVFGEIVYG